MKYNVLMLAGLLFIFKAEAQNNTNKKEKGFHLELDIPSQKNQMIYLGYYWKDAAYVRDSARLSDEGKTGLDLPEELRPGQYFLFINPGFRIDLLLDKGENDVHLYINEEDFAKSVATGSNNTKLLWTYLLDIQNRDMERSQLEKQLEDSTVSPQKRKALDTELEKLDESVQTYIQKTIKDNKDAWFGVFLKGLEPVALPYKQPKDEKEFLANREYDKRHFFDNMDLADPRLWFTNYLDSYINAYMQHRVDQTPDSLANAASRLVAKTKGNEFCFKEMLSKLINESFNSIRTDDENIWARLAEDYIFDKDATWIDSARYSELRKQYGLIKNNRIGMKARNLSLQTLDGKTVNTNDIDARCLLLYFYDSACRHCQTAVPDLHDKVYAKYKDKGLEVVAINLSNNREEWDSFVKNKKITGWINCADLEYKSRYWIYYDTANIPSAFVLDRDKKIVAKIADGQNPEKFFDFFKLFAF
ncbi:MAG: TlpA family protein disulfide reductase [Prevotella sp.]|jgi:peroxiredoxin|nr:TlpA family protein disulfide reductase [Prevotella sp.]